MNPISALQTIGEFYAYALEKGRLQPLIGPAADQLFGLDLVGKADHDLAATPGFRNIIYGAEVMDYPFREVNVLALFPQGNMRKKGFRVDTYDPATKGYGGADGGTVGTALAGDVTEHALSPGYLHTPWNETLAAQVESEIDDSVPLAMYNRERFKRIHAQFMNSRTIINAELAAADASALTTDAKADSTNLATPATYSGYGVETIDRWIASDAEEDQKGGTYAGWYDVADGGMDRDTGTTYDAQVVPQSGTHGTDAALSLAKLDELFRLTEAKGALPRTQILVTKRDTYDDVKDRVGPSWRIDMEEREMSASLAGIGGSLTETGTKPGPNVTFRVRAYEGRPFVLQEGLPADGAGRMYAMDMRDWRMEWIVPTLYLDGQSNYVLQNYFGNKALYLSGFRLVCDNPLRQGKLTDLS